MRRAVLALSVLVALVATCAPASAADPFRRHTVRGQGVSLAVPESWVAVDRRMPRSVLSRLARENPRLAPFIGQLSQRSSPMKFLALDPVVRQEFATNVNVVVTPLPAGVTFATYREGLIREVRSIGARRLRQAAVVVNGTQALRVQYRFDVTFGTKRTVQTLQYAFLRPGRSVVVTYTTLPSLAGRYAATFRRSAATIRLAR